MKHKIVIVDEGDNTIGYKNRDLIEQQDIYRVSALWISNYSGDILLARRALTKVHDPGKWGPAVAGTVEKQEDYKTNILKEAEEEIGLKEIVPQKGPKERVGGKHNYFVQWYLLKTNKPEEEFVIDRNEVEEIKWFSKKELFKKIQSSPELFLQTMERWVKLFCK